MGKINEIGSMIKAQHKFLGFNAKPSKLKSCYIITTNISFYKRSGINKAGKIQMSMIKSMYIIAVLYERVMT